MKDKYDHIIWGANANGITLASELIQQGQSVLLLNKFGFPGGNVTESLSCFFSKNGNSNNEFETGLIDSVRKLRFGVLFENDEKLLLHPEAVKRALWEEIDRINMEFLFHVIPIGIERGDFHQLQLFGRQGHFCLSAKEIHDLSEVQQLGLHLSVKDFKTDLMVHGFITGEIPEDLPGFVIYRRVKTSIGLYCSFQLKNIPLSESDTAFNLELDHFAQIIWKNYEARLMMIPVHPEIILQNE